MNVTIRRAQSSDARMLAEVNIASWRAAYRGSIAEDMLEDMSVEQRTTDWGYRLQDDKVIGAFVAESDGRIVGYALTTQAIDEDLDPGTTAELKALYLHPEAWRSGAGAALATRAIDDLSEKGVAVAVLWVLEGNERAIRFYERTGWSFDGTRLPCFRIFNAPALRYRRPLR